VSVRELNDGVKRAGRVSLRDYAYEEIKRRIIICEFKPGSPMNEAYVSDVLGTGRTPVHQAMLRLSFEGMVEILPRKGVLVKPVSFDEVMQIIDVRLLLETDCARTAAKRARKRDIASLRKVLRTAEKWVETRETEQIMLLDREFHFLLARISRNPVLTDLLTKLHERSLRFWFISLNQPRHHLRVQEQHTKIVDAIEDGNADKAELAMREHIQSTRENISRRL